MIWMSFGGVETRDGHKFPELSFTIASLMFIRKTWSLTMACSALSSVDFLSRFRHNSVLFGDRVRLHPICIFVPTGSMRSNSPWRFRVLCTWVVLDVEATEEDSILVTGFAWEVLECG